MVNLASDLTLPSRSVVSYSVYWLSEDPVETVTAVPAMLALTSGSTMMFRLAENGEDVCPFASERLVVYVTVVPADCCPALRLKVFEMVCDVSPGDPDPTLTNVAPAPSPKSHEYLCVAEKSELAPGFVAVSLVNVTGNPEVDSSFTPLIVLSATEYAAVCVEYTSKFLSSFCGYVAGSADECDNSVSLILYLVSPEPVPATVDPSSPPEFVYVCANLLPLTPPSALSLAIVSVVPSPQSTEYVTVAPPVFVVVFCR